MDYIRVICPFGRCNIRIAHNDILHSLSVILISIRRLLYFVMDLSQVLQGLRNHSLYFQVLVYTVNIFESIWVHGPAFCVHVDHGINLEWWEIKYLLPPFRCVCRACANTICFFFFLFKSNIHISVGGNWNHCFCQRTRSISSSVFNYSWWMRLYKLDERDKNEET